MDTGAIVMFVIGAVFLWGGVALTVTNYVRASRRSADA